MAVKKIKINENRTLATLQLNQKLIAGAGYVDKYAAETTLRGKFEQLRGLRTVDSGAVVPVQGYKFTTRYFADLAAWLELEPRLVITGKTFTITNFELKDFGHSTYIIIDLNLFS